MGALPRGLRNVYRNKGRALLVSLILGLSVGIFLTLNQTGTHIDEQIISLKKQVQTLVEIRAAGASGWGRGVENPLKGEVVDNVSALPHVVKVEKYVFRRSVDPEKKYTIAAIIGVVPGAALRLNSQGQMDEPVIIAGRNLMPGDGNVALMGKVYAEERGLSVGSRYTLNGTVVEVVGIFDAGFDFGNNQVFLPFDTELRIFEEGDIVTHIFATVDSVENVVGFMDAVKATLGEEADVYSGERRARYAAESLEKMQSNVKISAALAAFAAALVVLFTMVLITRERTREIGVLKAIGASNGDVSRQFAAEALALAALGTFLGLGIFAVGGSVLPYAILDLRSTAVTPAGSLSLPVLLEALGMVLAFGLIGSLYPVYRAVKVEPAVALRHE